MPNSSKTDRSHIKRHSERAHYDKESIYKIIDEAFICHVILLWMINHLSFPLFTHDQMTKFCSTDLRSRLLQVVKSGAPLSICVTHMDGLVLARSAMHSSMNYRSVVLFGTGEEITDNPKKLEAMEIFFEHLIPGRWRDIRHPNQKELDMTAVVAVEIEEASAKIRTGPPIDDEEDSSLPIWAGVVPFRLAAGEPEEEPGLNEEITLPNYLL